MKDLLERLASYNLPEETPEGCQIERLQGDASTREYYRITVPDSDSIVLMKMPAEFHPEEFPYLQNYDLFQSLRVPVAEILLMEPSRGYVFLQDLGDITLYEIYTSLSKNELRRYYLKSLDLLERIGQGQASAGLSFTTEKFLWELNFFMEHFLSKMKGIEPSDADRLELHHWFSRLAGECASTVNVLSHRDYHSRNLMVQQGQIYVIDFQDARMGPATYDLASLLYDSYVHHLEDIRSELEEQFFGIHSDPFTREWEYPRVCLQRSLKALGTFGYQVSRLGRNFYAQFVNPTLSYVRIHLDRLPEYTPLRNLLLSCIEL